MTCYITVQFEGLITLLDIYLWLAKQHFVLFVISQSGFIVATCQFGIKNYHTHNEPICVILYMLNDSYTEN